MDKEFYTAKADDGYGLRVDENYEVFYGSNASGDYAYVLTVAGLGVLRDDRTAVAYVMG